LICINFATPSGMHDSAAAKTEALNGLARIKRSSVFGRWRTRRALNEIAPSHCLPPRDQECADYCLQRCDYSRDLRSAEWGPTVILRGNNSQDRMSALAHKRTSQHVRAMSALPPNADIDRSHRESASGIKNPGLCQRRTSGTLPSPHREHPNAMLRDT